MALRVVTITFLVLTRPPQTPLKKLVA